MDTSMGNEPAAPAPLAERRGPGVRRRALGQYDDAELAQNDAVTPVTLPAHDVAFIEHGRGHARAEWALNRDDVWVVRADATYVQERLAAGERTLEVTTRRGTTQTVTITHVGTPFTSERGGNRLVQVDVLEGRRRTKRRRVAGSKAAPRPVPEGALPCDACGALRTTRFPATDRWGAPGWVCVRCDADRAAERVTFGTLEQDRLDVEAA